jgi:hypothetical protein
VTSVGRLVRFLLLRSKLVASGLIGGSSIGTALVVVEDMRTVRSGWLISLRYDDFQAFGLVLGNKQTHCEDAVHWVADSAATLRDTIENNCAMVRTPLHIMKRADLCGHTESALDLNLHEKG